MQHHGASTPGARRINTTLAKLCHLPTSSKKRTTDPYPRSSGTLLNKRELKSLKKDVDQKGNSIVPLRLFINENGWAKLEIALAKGKKMHDKRETMKDRDNKRDLARIKKNFNS